MHSTNFSLGTLVVADCWSQDTGSIRKDNNMHKWNSTEYLKREEFVTYNVTTKSLIYYLQSRCPDPSGQPVNYEAALRVRRTGSCLTFNLHFEILPFLPQLIITLSKLLSCEMPDQSQRTVSEKAPASYQTNRSWFMVFDFSTQSIFQRIGQM